VIPLDRGPQPVLSVVRFRALHRKSLSDLAFEARD
jgi:hypothetical protein